MYIVFCRSETWPVKEEDVIRSEKIDGSLGWCRAPNWPIIPINPIKHPYLKRFYPYFPYFVVIKILLFCTVWKKLSESVSIVWYEFWRKCSLLFGSNSLKKSVLFGILSKWLIWILKKCVVLCGSNSFWKFQHWKKFLLLFGSNSFRK